MCMNTAICTAHLGQAILMRPQFIVTAVVAAFFLFGFACASLKEKFYMWARAHTHAHSTRSLTDTDTHIDHLFCTMQSVDSWVFFIAALCLLCFECVLVAADAVVALLISCAVSALSSFSVHITTLRKTWMKIGVTRARAHTSVQNTEQEEKRNNKFTIW